MEGRAGWLDGEGKKTFETEGLKESRLTKRMIKITPKVNVAWRAQIFTIVKLSTTGRKHVAEKFKEHGIDHSFYWGSL